MDLKKKLKNFFTFDRRASDGFTLVELIVVIAILAILGGVAIPVYSGYVKKAEAAADEQLLAAVNTAFVSACLENGLDNYAKERKKDSDLIVDSAGKVTQVSTNDAINGSFGVFFVGNEDAAFKVNKDYVYGPEIGMFRLPENYQLTYTYNGKTHTMTISEKDKNSFNASGLAGVGVATLLGEMDNVVVYASDYDGLLKNVRSDSDFQDICKTFDGYPTGDADQDKAIEMQALVLYTAGKYDELDKKTLYTNIIANNGGYIANYATDGEDFAANAAMYSLGLVYATTEEGQKIMEQQGWDISNPDDIRELMTYCPDVLHPVTKEPTGEKLPNEFITWLEENEEEAMTNLDGFGGAMGMLTDNQGNLDTDMLLNGGGYGGSNLADSLAGLLGGN